MSIQELREVFNADRITRDLIEQVKQRGTEIAYDWIKRKAALGDTQVRIEVDGRAGVRLEDWRKRIRLSWAGAGQLTELLSQVSSAIRKATPNRTGRLESSWVWMFNSQFASYEEIVSKANSLGSRDVIRFVNTQPYIRKADRIYVPKGITGPVARRMARRFRGFVVYEQWLELPGVVVTRGILRARGNKGKHQGGLDQRLPCIAIQRSRKSLDVSALNG